MRSDPLFAVSTSTVNRSVLVAGRMVAVIGVRELVLFFIEINNMDSIQNSSTIFRKLISLVHRPAAF